MDDFTFGLGCHSERLDEGSSRLGDIPEGRSFVGMRKAIWKPKSRGINYTSFLVFAPSLLRRGFVRAAVVVVAHCKRRGDQLTSSKLLLGAGRGEWGNWLGRVDPRVETGIPCLG